MIVLESNATHFIMLISHLFGFLMLEGNHHRVLQVADLAVIDAGRHDVGIQCPAAVCCISCERVLLRKDKPAVTSAHVENSDPQGTFPLGIFIHPRKENSNVTSFYCHL